MRNGGMSQEQKRDNLSHNLASYRRAQSGNSNSSQLIQSYDSFFFLYISKSFSFHLLLKLLI